jgi:hypothetical protein
VNWPLARLVCGLFADREKTGKTRSNATQKILARGVDDTGSAGKIASRNMAGVPRGTARHFVL